MEADDAASEQEPSPEVDDPLPLGIIDTRKHTTLSSSVAEPAVPMLGSSAPAAAPIIPRKQGIRRFQPHVMISYQWDSQPLMIKVKEALQKAGYNVWMDVEKMGKV